MQTDEEIRNIEAFRAIIERIINDGETDLCERYMHPDMVIRRYGLASTTALLIPDFKPTSGGGGVTGFKAGLQQLRSAFPDWNHRVDKIVAKDDWVSGTWTLSCTHQGVFMGIAPTHRSISMNEAGFIRFVEGRMVEGWFIGDELALVRQLGVDCIVPKAG
ncbi:ester cyclase [Cupriavidus necator]|nr:ester cyclase [Cupriavidus necator]MDX6007611.1 ester cyclase [Cupriavidus necator]